MWLGLCERHDHAALWALVGLQRRGLAPLVVVTPEALVHSRRLAHEIRSGRPHVRFTLPDGREVHSNEVRGVLNRWRVLPLDHLQAAAAADAAYAAQEIQATVLSLLAGFGEHAVNAPSPQGLAGAERTPLEWALLAGRAGFDTVPVQMTSAAAWAPLAARRPVMSLVVLDDVVHAAGGRGASAAVLPVALRASCVALRRLAGVRLLGIDLQCRADAGWVFRAATPTPDLRVGGEPLLDALVAALRRADA